MSKISLPSITLDNLLALAMPIPWSGCFVWYDRCTSGDGYGQIVIDGKVLYAHRLALQLSTGLPDGMHALHHCDEPACIRPEHLFAGTHADNMHDMAHKGRCNVPYGEQSNAKLTEITVAKIRSLYATGLYSCRELGELYGVSYRTVGYIVNNKTWRH